jgi:hypothetical protein
MAAGCLLAHRLDQRRRLPRTGPAQLPHRDGQPLGRTPQPALGVVGPDVQPGGRLGQERVPAGPVEDNGQGVGAGL